MTRMTQDQFAQNDFEFGRMPEMIADRRGWELDRPRSGLLPDGPRSALGPSCRDLDLDREEDRVEWRRRLAELATARLSSARARFERLGIVDAEGKLVSTELPPDMLPESDTTLETEKRCVTRPRMIVVAGRSQASGTLEWAWRGGTRVSNGCRFSDSIEGILKVLLAKTLMGLVASAICAACGGHARTSPVADAEGGSSGTGAADSGPLPLNAPRSRLACGSTSTCFLSTQGGVRCWGVGFFGQLGDGSIDETARPPAAVTSLLPAIGLIGGAAQTCAFAASDAAECWGLLPSLVATSTPTPTSLGLMGVATIAFSGHACAVTRAGDVYCWGPDEFLGNGTGPSESPLQVAGLHDAIDVAVGANTDLGSGVATLVVRADGSVVGWGHAHGPGLTIGGSTDLKTPIPMPGLNGVRQITLGSSHACALLADATVVCWGSNSGGRLGSSSPDTLVPQLVTGLSDVAEVRAGEAITCARRTNGQIRCWGSNAFEALAQPQPLLPWSHVPVTIDVPPIVDMAVGQEHVCVLDSDENVWCWGNNYGGQIAMSDEVTIDTPTLVSP